jgi:aminoglycoside phosphotransferase (APT) family kinase protein
VPERADIEGFLRGWHGGAPVRDLEPLTGGYWSSAWAYDVGDDRLVARFGEMKDGFEADRDAMAYASADLPVPDVLDVGDAPWGGAYAISRRFTGRFLEDMGPEVAPALAGLLAALRAVPPDDTAPSWRDDLLERLVVDQPPGWREKLRAHPESDAAFERAAERLRSLIPSLPERRDLIHGDLLHKNVLVSDDGARVNAVFSWKCSVRGDHLYDTAWCTFWGDLAHPGIGAAVDRTMADDEERYRHHVYELHIAATHLGWYAWTDDDEWLPRTTEVVNRLTAPA